MPVAITAMGQHGQVIQFRHETREQLVPLYIFQKS
jgi:hypothetical protein